MNKKKVVAIATIAIMLIATIVFAIVKGVSSSKSKKNNSNNVEDDYGFIMINEDLSKNGKVKNLDNVIWNNANIRMNHDNSVDVDIYLTNESTEKDVDETELEVKLLNKDGDVIGTQSAIMERMNANYGYARLDLSFEIDEFDIVYDIEITAK